MELALVVSIVSICGFAAALTYNVYEFRKVGRELDGLGDRMDKRFNKLVEKMSEDHKEIVAALRSLAPKSKRT